MFNLDKLQFGFKKIIVVIFNNIFAYKFFNRVKVCNPLEKIYRKTKPQVKKFYFLDFEL